MKTTKEERDAKRAALKKHQGIASWSPEAVATTITYLDDIDELESILSHHVNREMGDTIPVQRAHNLGLLTEKVSELVAENERFKGELEQLHTVRASEAEAFHEVCALQEKEMKVKKGMSVSLLNIDKLIKERSQDKAMIARLDELRIALVQEREEARAEVARLKGEVERLQVQLAGCGVAALGGIKDTAEKSAYGWSPSYQDVVNLRKKYESALGITSPESDTAKETK